MKNITYITNTNITQTDGGGSGVNAATFHILNKNFNADVVTIQPGPDHASKIKSILLKILKLKRNYHHFSEKRLLNFFFQFKKDIKGKTTDAYFFHGFTSWVKIKPQKPYYCFNDACFATYVAIYNNKTEFSNKDLDRIYQQEALWLINAKNVFFRSQWALEETKERYQIEGENFLNVGVGGFIDIPDMDYYKEGLNFLFISREFIPKGGLVVVEAIEKLRLANIDANLWIIGEDPGRDVRDKDGIEYHGFFDKKKPDEKLKLIHYFQNAFALVHPTKKDTNTLVINELAYFGCPAISSNMFAIPEYLIDGYTGYLINDPDNKDEVASKMKLMIQRPELYSKMRIQARQNAIRNNTWAIVGSKITAAINE